MRADTPSLHERLIQKLTDLWDLYESLYVLVNGSTTEIQADFEQSRLNIQGFTNAQLRRLLPQLREKVVELKTRYGAIASDSDIVNMARLVKEVEGNQVALVPKYILETVFTNYRAVVKDFDSLPAHTRIGVYPGRFRAKQGTIELYLLEASLFEDMCSLNNMLVAFPRPEKKVDTKRYFAVARSLIDAAFRFMEAYLNGIAFDFHVRKHAELSVRDRDALSEWDSATNRTRYVSFRNKLIKYPQIIGGFKEPPLTEESCQELKSLLEKSKTYRDAIVHASPFLEPKELVPEKESAFYSLSAEDALKTVELVIAIVARIHEVLGRTPADLPWFRRRGPDGLFSEEVFA